MANARDVTAACAGIFASMQVESGRGVGPAVAAAGFAANGIVLHEAGVEGVRAALVGLIQTLAHPSQTVIILPEHREAWAWCGQVCLFTTPPPFNEHDWHLHQLCVATVRAHLAGGIVDGSGDPNTTYLGMDSSTIASYLPFPLLEGVLKKQCADYIRPDGVVVTEFRCVAYDGGERVYRVGKLCSNVGHLLQLAFGSTDSEALRADLQQVFDFIAPGRPIYQACDEVFAWRNGSLHGETHTPAGGAVVLQVALLILIHLISGDYEARRMEALQEILHVHEFGRPSPHSFYPHR